MYLLLNNFIANQSPETGLWHIQLSRELRVEGCEGVLPPSHSTRATVDLLTSATEGGIWSLRHALQRDEVWCFSRLFHGNTFILWMCEQLGTTVLRIEPREILTPMPPVGPVLMPMCALLGTPDENPRQSVHGFRGCSSPVLVGGWRAKAAT